MPRLGQKHDHCDFAHRTRSDGHFDSICLSCYLTVATTDSEESLSFFERMHPCYRKKPPKKAQYSYLADNQFFVRTVVSAGHSVFSSECQFCGAVVGHSEHVTVLEIAESVHQCPSLQEARKQKRRFA